MPQVRVRCLDANLGGGMLVLDCRRFLLPASPPFIRRRQPLGVRKWDCPDGWKHHRSGGAEKTYTRPLPAYCETQVRAQKAGANLGHQAWNGDQKAEETTLEDVING